MSLNERSHRNEPSHRSETVQRDETAGMPALMLRVVRNPENKQLLAIETRLHSGEKNALISVSPPMLQVVQNGLGCTTYMVSVEDEKCVLGYVGLALIASPLFGRFLVSLPYFGSAGVISSDTTAAAMLVDQAVRIADECNVRYMELRHEQSVSCHSMLVQTVNDRVHLRLELPQATSVLWKQIPSKVRNQIRKAQSNNLVVSWGGADSLSQFYDVFCSTMRDLGTPVYGRRLFESLAEVAKDRFEIGVVRSGACILAAGILLHGSGVSEIPSAGMMRAARPTNANMMLYWASLVRTIERGNYTFDFGRSRPGSGPYRFKKQWGAMEYTAHWQYYMRQTRTHLVRPEVPTFRLLRRAWKHLPVALANALGPAIIRCIP